MQYENIDKQGENFSARSFLRGVRKAIPIVFGYLPVAFTFGVLAAKAEFSTFEAGLTGLLVFAGSGQLIAVNLILAGVSPLSIIVTTFVVNARHMLMSAALAPFLGRWKRLQQVAFCLEMTDETFALNIGRFAELGVDKGEAFGVNITSHLAWLTGGIIGCAFGNLIGDLKPYGLDFALAGMFVALLTPHLRIYRHLMAALVGGGISAVLYLNGVEQWNILIATAAAASLCLFLPEPKAKASAKCDALPETMNEVKTKVPGSEQLEAKCDDASWSEEQKND